MMSEPMHACIISVYHSFPLQFQHILWYIRICVILTVSFAAAAVIINYFAEAYTLELNLMLTM